MPCSPSLFMFLSTILFFWHSSCMHFSFYKFTRQNIEFNLLSLQLILLMTEL